MKLHIDPGNYGDLEKVVKENPLMQYQGYCKLYAKLIKGGGKAYGICSFKRAKA